MDNACSRINYQNCQLENIQSGEFAPILIVDDDPFIISIVQELLKQLNLKSDTANNGVEAIQKIFLKINQGQAIYQIIFMDFQMSGKDGLVVAKEIDDLCKLNNIKTPQICISSDQGNELSHNYDRLDKPIKFEQLQQYLEKMKMIYI